MRRPPRDSLKAFQVETEGQHSSPGKHLQTWSWLASTVDVAASNPKISPFLRVWQDSILKSGDVFSRPEIPPLKWASSKQYLFRSVGLTLSISLFSHGSEFSEAGAYFRRSTIGLAAAQDHMSRTPAGRGRDWHFHDRYFVHVDLILFWYNNMK